MLVWWDSMPLSYPAVATAAPAQLLRRVSRLSKSTWRMGKVIGDYAPSFQGEAWALMGVCTPHMANDVGSSCEYY